MAISYVRSASASSDGTTSTTIAKAFGAAVASGVRLLAFIDWGATTGTVTRIDDTVNGSGGWTRIAASNTNDSNGPQQGEVWELRSSLAGTPTITANYSVAQPWRGIIIVAVVGADPNVAANVATARAIAAASTSFTTLGVTPSVAGAYIAAFCTNDTNSVQPTATGGSGYTLRETPGTSTTQVTGFEDQVQGAAASIAADFTFASGVLGTVHLVALAPSLAVLPVSSGALGGAVIDSGPLNAAGGSGVVAATPGTVIGSTTVAASALKISRSASNLVGSSAVAATKAIGVRWDRGALTGTSTLTGTSRAIYGLRKNLVSVFSSTVDCFPWITRGVFLRAFRETFSGGTIPSGWTTDVYCSVVGGVFQMDGTTHGALAAAPGTYNAIGSQFTIELVSVPTGTGQSAGWTISEIAAGEYGITVAIEAGTLRLSVQDFSPSTTFDSVNHRWLRLVIDLDQALHLLASPDPRTTAFTEILSIPGNSGTFSGDGKEVSVSFAASSGVFRFDNLNVVPQTAPATATILGVSTLLGAARQLTTAKMSVLAGTSALGTAKTMKTSLGKMSALAGTSTVPVPHGSVLAAGKMATVVGSSALGAVTQRRIQQQFLSPLTGAGSVSTPHGSSIASGKMLALAGTSGLGAAKTTKSSLGKMAALAGVSTLSAPHGSTLASGKMVPLGGSSALGTVKSAVRSLLVSTLAGASTVAATQRTIRKGTMSALAGSSVLTGTISVSGLQLASGSLIGSSAVAIVVRNIAAGKMTTRAGTSTASGIDARISYGKMLTLTGTSTAPSPVGNKTGLAKMAARAGTSLVAGISAKSSLVHAALTGASVLTGATRAIFGAHLTAAGTASTTGVTFGGSLFSASGALVGSSTVLGAVRAIRKGQGTLAGASALAGRSYRLQKGITPGVAGTAVLAGRSYRLATSTSSISGTSVSTGRAWAIRLGVGSRSGLSTVVATTRAILSSRGALTGSSASTGRSIGIRKGSGLLVGASVVLGTAQLTGSTMTGSAAGASTIISGNRRTLTGKAATRVGTSSLAGTARRTTSAALTTAGVSSTEATQTAIVATAPVPLTGQAGVFARIDFPMPVLAAGHLDGRGVVHRAGKAGVAKAHSNAVTTASAHRTRITPNHSTLRVTPNRTETD